MSAPVDVLAVMDAVLAFAARGVESDDPAREMIESGYEARAAVAKLIEADKALDAANLALNTTDPQSEDAETMESMHAHRQRCIKRRAAALARIGGANP